ELNGTCAIGAACQHDAARGEHNKAANCRRYRETCRRSFSTIVSGRTAMKRLSILAGLAMLTFATPSQAAEEKTCDAWINGRYVPCAGQQGSQGTPQQTGWEPPANSGVERCGYGGGQNCWQAPDGSWWKGPK